MARQTYEEKSADTNPIAGEKEFRRVLSSSTLTGDRVRNTTGEDLGKLEEIMIDVVSGRVAYAVLSFGGFLGMGNKLFAVPWRALSLNESDHEFVLDVDRETLENAPGFDRDNWPDMTDPTWESQILTHYGYTGDWDTDTGRPGRKTLSGGGGL